MKGIVLLSHGSLARGLADAATFFMGDSIEQLEYRCLRQDSSPDEFAEELKRAIEKVDTGEGAVILADLFGGTPCNQAARLLDDRTDLISGMNFPVLLELLTARMAGEIDVAALVESARSGISDVKVILNAQAYDETEE